MGERAFVQGVYSSDWIRRFFNGRQYRCALFLLGLVDFLCRKNQIRKDVRYEEYRKVRLDKPDICSAHGRKDRMQRAE